MRQLPAPTDPGDATDLTDGIHYDPGGTSLWAQKAASGAFPFIAGKGQRLLTVVWSLSVDWRLPALTSTSSAVGNP